MTGKFFYKKIQMNESVNNAISIFLSFQQNNRRKEKKMISFFFLTFIYLFIYFVLPKQFQVIFSSKPNKYACSKYVCRHYASALLVQTAKELLTSHVHSPHKNNFFLEKRKKRK